MNTMTPAPHRRRRGGTMWEGRKKNVIKNRGDNQADLRRETGNKISKIGENV